MFQFLFERTSDAVWLINPDTGAVVDCNEAASVLMRCTNRADLIGRRLEELSAPERKDGLPIPEAVRRIGEKFEGRNSKFDWKARRFDGTEVILDGEATAVERDGKTMIVLVSREADERKEAQDARLESAAGFGSFFERNADAMSFFDPQTLRYIETNDAVARLLGAPSREALRNTSPVEGWPKRQPDGRLSIEKVREMIQLALTQGSHRFEWLSHRYDGTELPLDVVLTAVPLAGRTVLSMVYRDISERKLAEDEIRRLNASLEKRVTERTIELVRANEQLKRADEELRKRNNQMQKHRNVLLELVQSNKLDLKLALQEICSVSAATLDVARVSYWSVQEDQLAVSCNVMYLRDTERFDHQFKGRRLVFAEYPAYFDELASKRTIVANDVLSHPATRDLAKNYLRPLGISSVLDTPVWEARLMEEALLIGGLDAGKIEFKPQPLELRPFVQRLVDEVLSATNWRCPIEVSLAEMPPEIQADERLLQHIFTNLLANGVKYSDPGWPVRFEIASVGAEIVCSIHDQGIGIPEADREWLFTAFHRGQNVGDRPGSGLGLVIVKGSVDLHGGKIKVESQFGRGTVVTVRLPVFCPERPAEGVASNAPPAS